MRFEKQKFIYQKPKGNKVQIELKNLLSAINNAKDNLQTQKNKPIRAKILKKKDTQKSIKKNFFDTSMLIQLMRNLTETIFKSAK